MTSETIGFGCNFQIVETYSATDPCGNTGYTSRTLNVVDTTAPSLVGVPANITIDCNDGIPAAGNVTAIDNCDVNVTISVQETYLPGNCPSNYTIERMYTATDQCGNSSTAVQVINIVDTNAPIFNADNETFFSYSCPSITFGETAPVVTPVAVEDCSSLTVTYTDVESGTNCNRQITRTWTAADACGNASTFVQNITIIDNEAPQFAGPNHISAPCDNYAGILNVTATDNCSGAVEVTIEGEVISGSDCSRLVTRSYRATDDCGNVATFVQTIQLLDDVTPSVVNPPVTAVVRCNQAFPIYTPTWTDNCDADLTLSVSTFVESQNCTTLIHNVYSATDDCGNTSTVDYIITLIEDVAPVIQSNATQVEFDCLNAIPLIEPNAYDDCSSVELAYTEEVIETPETNTLFRTWTATDACGNQSNFIEVYHTTLGYPGSACDDGNPCTVNDKVTEECGCAGTPSAVAVGTQTIQACGSYSWNGQTYTASGTYSYSTQTEAGCDSIAQLVLSIGTPTFSTEQATACGNYLWNGTVYTQSGTYTFVTTNSSGCPNTATLNLTVQTASIAPTAAIASANNVNSGTQVTLTVQGGSLGSNATWMWYRGTCGGTWVGNGSSITVTANATETYYVRAQGSCNTTACASITINVLSAQCGPEQVSASATRICSGSSTTLSVIGTLYPGAIWRWRRNSCTGTIVGTGATLSVAPTTNTTYYVRAEGGTCGITVCMQITITVDKIPASPSVINGPVSGLCNMQNVTYSVTPVSTVQQYNWTLPPGVTLVSGQGTASVTVNFSNFIGTNSTNGNPAICVTAQNTCGNSPIRCLSLSTYPATPAAISGPAQPCINTVNTYSCTDVYGAASYAWLVPTGWVIQTGQGTASITVLCNGTGGNVRVRSTNACGTSGLRSFAVTPKACSTAAMPMQLELWPNPTSDRVFLAHGDLLPDHLQIYDMLGRNIYSGSWVTEFDVSQLSSGIYFVRATSGEESVVKRMEVTNN